MPDKSAKAVFYIVNNILSVFVSFLFQTYRHLLLSLVTLISCNPFQMELLAKIKGSRNSGLKLVISLLRRYFETKMDFVFFL